MAKVLSVRLCENMNSAARRIARERGISNVDALLQVATNHGLKLAREIDAAAQTRLYQFADGTLVNLWIDAPSDQIEDGGLGFDDQVDD